MHFAASGCMDCKVKSAYSGQVFCVQCDGDDAGVQLPRYSDRAVLDGLEKVQVKGRVEILPVSKDYSMIIDYAHNEVSTRSVLTTLLEYHPKRLILCLWRRRQPLKLKTLRYGQ